MPNNTFARRLGRALRRRQKKQNADNSEYNSENKNGYDLGKSPLRENTKRNQKPNENENDRNDSPSDRSVAESTRAIAILTGALVFVTIISSVISFFQWKEIHDGGIDTHHLADAAGKQANAAATQAATMASQLDAFIFQQRPNVVVNPYPAPYYIEDVNLIGWNIAYMNSGQRDAVSFTMKWYMSVDGEPFHLNDFTAPENLSGGRLPAFVTARSKSSFTIPQAQALYQRDLSIRILVQVSYVGELKQNVRLTFCWGRLKSSAVAHIKSEECEKDIEKIR